jgi:CheY-like chemotaxis protein
MGSKLEVNSTYGEGSVFFFFLKQKIIDFELVGDFKKAMTDIHSSINVFREEFTAPDARILVVDDVDMNLKVFRGLLKKSLIQIDTASSGFEAIDMIRTNTYDCIFMDHQMPDMDGIETFQKLREDPDIDIDNTPVIALTANAISGARETYLKAGFSDYLAKPINGWDLSALLQKHLPAIKIQEAPDDDATAADILLLFLQEEKKALFRKKGNLNRAYYEFYFDLRPSKGDNVYKKEFDSNVKMICKLIEIGVASGEFVCDDPLTAALNIVYVLEEMKTTALTMGVSPDSFDRQILYILQSLGVDA